MPEPIPVQIPLLNPNEPEAALVALYIQEKQPLQPGDLICTIETTKSTADITAEHGGFVTGITAKVGQTVQAGQVLCYLVESAEVQLEVPAQNDENQPQHQPDLPAGLRITRPALSLAQSLGLDLYQLPVGPLITESSLKKLFNKAAPPANADASQSHPIDFNPNSILIYGGGGHGKSLIDLVHSLGIYHIAGIIDDGIESSTIIMGVPVLGGGDLLPALRQQGLRLALNAVGGIGNLKVRLQVSNRLTQAGFVSPTVAHPSAVIETSARLAPGGQVFAHAYIGSETQVGTGAIINTGAIISHECIIGDYANLSPGAILAGQVEIGTGALVGMGVTINLQVKVGANARIGNSATVKSDVPDGAIVRAGSIWPS